MWLRKGTGGDAVLVPEHMRDTITRCLGDGWVEIPDPRIPVAPEPIPAPTTQPQPTSVPDEAAKALEQERIAAVVANNKAARAAFADMGMGPKQKGRR